MKAEVREALAVYQVWCAEQAKLMPFDVLSWEEIDSEWRELDMQMAEAAVKKLAEILVPVLVLSESDVKRLLEQLGGGAE